MALISLGESKKPALIDLLGKSREELREFAVETGQPKYRGEQLYHALYSERLSDLSAISSLPAAWREKISAIAEISLPRIVRRFQSTDGSVRYLLEIHSDGAPTAQIEAVFMPDPRKDGNR